MIEFLYRHPVLLFLARQLVGLVLYCLGVAILIWIAFALNCFASFVFGSESAILAFLGVCIGIAVLIMSYSIGKDVI